MFLHRKCSAAAARAAPCSVPRQVPPLSNTRSWAPQEQLMLPAQPAREAFQTDTACWPLRVGGSKSPPKLLMAPPGPGVALSSVGSCLAGLAAPACPSLCSRTGRRQNSVPHSFRAPSPPAHLGMGSEQHGQNTLWAPGADPPAAATRGTRRE